MITDNSNNGMHGSGLFVINCPWSIEKDIKKSLETIFDCLKKSNDLSKLLFKNIHSYWRGHDCKFNSGRSSGNCYSSNIK